jgi:glycosyltransferase involved in cell wall biosynthesis
MSKIGVFVTHPIQYQVPIWRALAADKNFDVKVYYFCDQGVNSESVDKGFGKKFAWDLPLLDGYDCEFLTRDCIENAGKFSIPDVHVFFKKNKFDIVLITGYMHRFTRQIIANKDRYKYKVLFRGELHDEHHTLGWLKKIVRDSYLKWFYNKVDCFCSIGKISDQHLLNHGVTDDKITFSPYVVDNVLFEQRSKELSRDAERKALGIKDSDTVFLFSGKMIPRKRPLFLGKALIKLNRQRQDFSVIYLGDGPLFEELKQLLLPVLGKRFIAPGFINQRELSKYFLASDVFVLPSYFDAWGLVVNEAMHFALPVITSDKCCCHADLVKTGETGYVFKTDDLAELHECLLRFLDAPEERTRTMGSQAYALIQDYTIDKAVGGIVQAAQTANN